MSSHTTRGIRVCGYQVGFKKPDLTALTLPLRDFRAVD
jgi:hypothetical protein